MQYERVLEQLLSLEHTSFPSENIYVSCYLPAEFEHRQDFAVYIKSNILEGLRKYKNVSVKSEIYQLVVDKILSDFKGLEDFKNGVAIFAAFDPYDLGEKNEKVFSLIVPLHRKPKQEIIVFNHFDVDQLLWLDNLNSFALVLLEKESKLYVVSEGNISHVKDFDNDFLNAENRTAMSKFSPKQGSEYFHGVAPEDNFENEQDKHFLKKIIGWIRENAEKYEVKYLTVFLSPKFVDLKDVLEEELSEMKDLESILINKILKVEKEILKETWDAVLKRYKELKLQVLENAKSNFKNYVEGWDAVVEAVNENRIAVLFAEPTAEQEGYLDENDQITLATEEGNNSFGNIAPWVIKKVYETGGKVIVFKDQKIGADVSIAAQLRY